MVSVFKIHEGKLLNTFLLTSLLSLLMGVLAIAVTLFCRAIGGSGYFNVYYWSLSGHGFSMLGLWVPSIIAYFFINENRGILKKKIHQSILAFGICMFAFSQLGVLVSYFFVGSTQLTRFILTPNSTHLIFFFLLNSFSQVIIFFMISFGLSTLLKETKEKETKLNLYVGILASLSLAVSAGFSNVLLQRGFWQDEWSEHLWLPLGHFSMQAITMVLYHLWSLRFLKNQEQFVTIRLCLYLGYPLFVFLGYVHLFPELFRVNVVGHWEDRYVWIPAISSLFFTLYLSFFIFRFFKKDNVVYILSFLLFVLVGGVTGLKIIADLLFKTRVLDTLFMPGHFHPLLLGGFTLSMIFYLYDDLRLSSLKVQRVNNIFFGAFLVGVSSFSFLLMYLGLGRSLRRHPVLVDLRIHNLSWVLLGLSGVAIVSILGLVLRLVALKANKSSGSP